MQDAIKSKSILGLKINQKPPSVGEFIEQSERYQLDKGKMEKRVTGVINRL